MERAWMMFKRGYFLLCVFCALLCECLSGFFDCVSFCCLFLFLGVKSEYLVVTYQ
jgi:hypothetical protein